MIRLLKTLLIFLLTIQISFAQPGAKQPQCLNEAFNKEVTSLIDFSVPVLDVDQLKDIQEDVVILDAREQKEYDVSHIDGAKCIGFDHFDITSLEGVDKDDQIVLYCSVGYRSEKIGEKLKAEGFTNVYNLYGSIFEWVNRGNEVVDSEGNPTKQLHTYDLLWSKWVNSEDIEKVW